MSNLIKGNKYEWETVIGLEIHAQVKSNSKLFSNSSTAFGSKPNSQVSLVDAAMPGMLPVINSYCIEQAIKTGIGLKAKINNYSVFDRKNYFYADLPQGYQISQFKDPIVGEGKVILDMPDGQKEVGIERLHLEQDAGKSIHDQDIKNTLIDLNRSGCALMEIVSEPDLRSPEEAALYVKKLRSILRCIGSCDGNMEKGNLRADVNVSVRKPDSEMGTRCEIKNVNSIKFIQQAIEYEARRQVELIENGKEIIQETRLFDPNKGETRSMRGKEESHDYRYFPDPDLPPLIISKEKIEELRKSLPELPDEKKSRFISEYNLTNYDAQVLTDDQYVSDFFEEVVKNRDPKLVVSWISVELFSYLKKNDIELSESKISPKKIANLLDFIISGKISNRQAKELFEPYLKSNLEAKDFIEKMGVEQVSDEGEIEELINRVLQQNPKMVEDYKNGKDKLFGFFVGQVMKESKGKANPQIVNKILQDKLA